MLLEGLCELPDIEHILADVPPRSIVDRLIFKYFNSTETINGTYTHPLGVTVSEYSCSHSPRAGISAGGKPGLRFYFARVRLTRALYVVSAVLERSAGDLNDMDRPALWCNGDGSFPACTHGRAIARGNGQS